MASGDASAARGCSARGESLVTRATGSTPRRSVGLGLLDLGVVGLDPFVVLVDRVVRRFHMRLGERLLLADEFFQAIDVVDVTLLPDALLVVAREAAGELAGFRERGARHRGGRRRCRRRGGGSGGLLRQRARRGACQRETREHPDDSMTHGSLLETM